MPVTPIMVSRTMPVFMFSQSLLTSAWYGTILDGITHPLTYTSPAPELPLPTPNFCFLYNSTILPMHSLGSAVDSAPFVPFSSSLFLIFFSYHTPLLLFSLSASVQLSSSVWTLPDVFGSALFYLYNKTFSSSILRSDQFCVFIQRSSRLYPRESRIVHYIKINKLFHHVHKLKKVF